MAEKPAARGEIFVVDDDPAVRETLSVVLSAGGYEVICFADGAALLAVGCLKAKVSGGPVRTNGRHRRG